MAQQLGWPLCLWAQHSEMKLRTSPGEAAIRVLARHRVDGRFPASLAAATDARLLVVLICRAAAAVQPPLPPLLRLHVRPRRTRSVVLHATVRCINRCVDVERLSVAKSLVPCLPLDEMSASLSRIRCSQCVAVEANGPQWEYAG